MYNGKENQVTGNLGLLDFGARMYDPEIVRWTVPDPMAEKYPAESPYTFTLNNPVRYVDPFGLDVWEINSDGSIANRIEDDTQDAFYIVDSDGQRTGQSIVFEYGTITGVRTEPINITDKNGNIVSQEPITMFGVQGDDNATHLFEFMANPGVTTDVEWSHIK